jgi:hypothetical protein
MTNGLSEGSSSNESEIENPISNFDEFIMRSILPDIINRF